MTEYANKVLISRPEIVKKKPQHFTGWELYVTSCGAERVRSRWISGVRRADREAHVLRRTRHLGLPRRIFPGWVGCRFVNRGTVLFVIETIDAGNARKAVKNKLRFGLTEQRISKERKLLTELTYTSF